MKTILKISAILPIIISPLAQANMNENLGKYFSGGVGFSSDYAFRGISQTNEDPAIQGNIDFNRKGFKLGVWGSNVNFGDAHSEFDLYSSYTLQCQKFSWENGVIYYAYPGARSDSHFNYTEAFSSATYDFTKFKLNSALYYSPKFSADSGRAFYPKIGFSVPLPHDLTFDGSIGRQFVQNNAKYGVPEYNDWNLGVAYAVGNGLSVKAQYVDTNISKIRCDENCDSRAIFSVSKSF